MEELQDVLTITEDVTFDCEPIDEDMLQYFVTPGLDVLTGLPTDPSKWTKKDPNNNQETAQAKQQPTTSTNCHTARNAHFNRTKKTPRDGLSLKGINFPFWINGSMRTDLERLLPSTTIEEIKMRIDNEVQRFVTREEESIYIPKRVLQRLDLDSIQRRKQPFTVNLPDRFQVILRIKADGKVVFYRHHKRGTQRRLQRVLNSTVQRGENVCSAPKREEKQT